MGHLSCLASTKKNNINIYHALSTYIFFKKGEAIKHIKTCAGFIRFRDRWMEITIVGIPNYPLTEVGRAH
jgi:hypothetical protein